MFFYKNIRNILSKYFDFIRNLSFANMTEWQIAIRRTDSKGKLFEGNLSNFKLIPNSIRYWYADPFLFTYSGKEYIFAEMYDRKKGKGIIGYAKIRNRKLRFKKCIDLPYHLSYPCIYEYNGVIYMIPECYQSGSVKVYKCLSFPNKWIEDETIVNRIAVDTTPCEINKKLVFFSTFFDSVDRRINDNLFLIDSSSIRNLKINDFSSRSAGHIFTNNNILIRPSQNCHDGYGSRLIFSRIDSLTEKDYKESELCRISAPDDDVDNSNIIEIVNKRKHKYKGIHTYNFDNNYEVVDLKYTDGRNIYAFYRNLKAYLCWRIFGLK